MRQRNRERAARDPRKRALDVRPRTGVAAHRPAGCRIAGAGDPERCAAPRTFDRTIDQHNDSQRFQPGPHLGPPRIHVVIAGDGKHAERRAQAAKCPPERLDITRIVVDLIAGEHDRVRLRRLDGVDDAADVTGRGVRTEVEIGELDDAQSIERRGQIGIARIERLDAQPARADVAEDRSQRERRACDRHGPSPHHDAAADERAEDGAGGGGQRDQRRTQLDVEKRPEDPDARGR